jgi:hypothetical protein
MGLLPKSIRWRQREAYSTMAEGHGRFATLDRVGQPCCGRGQTSSAAPIAHDRKRRDRRHAHLARLHLTRHCGVQ